MIPLLNYPWLSLLSVLMGFGICAFLTRRTWITDRMSRLEQALQNHSRARLIAGFGLGLFLLWAYFTHPIYYFPFNAGVTGDNYLHLSGLLERSHYLKHHHLFFPLSAELIVDLVEKLGWLAPSDPRYLEKIFVLASAPARLATVLGILLFVGSLRRFGWSWLQAVLSVFVLATSYALWIWALQPNGLGLALGFQLITSACFLTAFRKDRAPWLLGAAILGALNVYVYNGSLYFVAGAFAALLVHLGFRSRLPGLTRGGLVLASALGSLALAWGFVEIQWVLFPGIHGLEQVFENLSDTRYFGPYEFNLSKFLQASLVNVSGSLMNLTNYWSPETLFEKICVLIQRSSFIALAYSFWKSRPRLGEGARRSAFDFFLFTSAVTFIGFALRQSGTHYYALAAVPNLGLFLLLLWDPKAPKNLIPSRLALVLALSLAGFFYSAFGTTRNILQVTDARGNEYYREAQAIASVLAPDETAIYFRRYESAYIPQGLARYYSQRFGRIHLRDDSMEIQRFINTQPPKTRLFLHQSAVGSFMLPHPPQAIGEDVHEVKIQ